MFYRIYVLLEELDQLINEQVTGWKTSRMNKVDLTVLRLAVYEIKWDEDVPLGVAFAISFICTDSSKHDHLHPILHTKCKRASLPGKHNAGNHSTDYI